MASDMISDLTCAIGVLSTILERYLDPALTPIDVEELLDVSLTHAFTSLLLFLFLNKKKKSSMRKYATNGQGGFMKRHGLIGLGGQMSYVTSILILLHEKKKKLTVGFNRLQNRLHNLGYTQKDIDAAFLSLFSRFSKTGVVQIRASW